MQWFYETVVVLHELLAEDGSLYVHIGSNVSHYVKAIMDGMFGLNAYINEVIWKRQAAHSDTAQGSKHYGRLHDPILFYTKGEHYTWNPQHEPYDQEYIDTFYRHVEERTGRRYRLGDLTAPKPGGDTSYEWKGVRPYRGR